MNSNEIRQRFLKFFEERGHTIIPSASLVPENDPSVLFNTAGMQPMVPYFMGLSHPSGSVRLANSQKCVRTCDLDEAGDNTHATFFEMLGNWSLGDYFKIETIKWSFEFLTSKEEGLGLDPSRLYVTVFEGDDNAPKDDVAFTEWKKYLPESRIYFMSADTNWWSPGDNGPCGPDSEMFYDVSKDGLGDMTKEEYIHADERQDIVEIWNDVFMAYEKKDGKVIGKLKQKNIDTGAGLERLSMVSQGKDNIFETDIFADIIAKIDELKTTDDVKAKRIIADHIRTSVFLIADGVLPSNTDQGYILRRLLRRAVRFADVLGLDEDSPKEIIKIIVHKYEEAYPVLVEKHNDIVKVIGGEVIKFRKTLKSGEKNLKSLIIKQNRKPIQGSDEEHKVYKDRMITGGDLFKMYATYGFPLELSIEVINHELELLQLGVLSDTQNEKITEEFWVKMKEHQALSKAGSEQKFKGGLAGHGEMEIKYHTATHLLHKALQEVLGPDTLQRGSNITAERLRFDFSHDTKMTDEEKQKVTDLVNEKIKESLPITFQDLSYAEAKKRNPIGLFEDKYGDVVRLYQVGPDDNIFSLELCGGPHVENTGDLGVFRIKKEQASSAGVRRIKAVLE